MTSRRVLLVSCLRKVDYVFILGLSLLVTGLATRLYLWNGLNLEAPLLILLFPLTCALFAIAGKRGFNGQAALLASSLVAVLASPYIYLSVFMLEDYIRSGRISSPFVNDLVIKGGKLASVAIHALTFMVFLSALLLGNVLARRLLRSLKAEGVSNPVSLLSESANIRSWSVFGILVGVLAVLLAPGGSVDAYILAPLLVFIFLAPLPVQASLVFYWFLAYHLGVTVGVFEALLTLLVYTLAVGAGSDRGRGEIGSTLLAVAVSSLLLILVFFVLFGMLFPVYMAVFTVYIVLAAVLVVHSEGRGFATSPFVASYVLISALYPAITELRQISYPLAPLLVTSIPGILAGLYSNLLRPHDEECSYNAVIAISLAALPLSMVLLSASTVTITYPQPRVQATLFLPEVVVLVIAAAVTLLQRYLSGFLLNKGSRLFVPASITVLHPLGLVLASSLHSLLPQSTLLYLFLFLTASMVLKIVAFLGSTSLRDFNIMVVAGIGIGLLLRLLS
ncbi:hypothetical protein IG193_04335 [Infirmifilum lucidum]|uniref:Uncharacterized protein n=1 Tax=Infirmifilum lucidum TaxID=2776706 RepID=A0A7L9FIM3_9CREN|nr:hypothetical protein [Infirmifilum lucidum]QOJ79688.1 hypothetical protein IG193_04335 [Infirmifilum lucidum]